MGWFDKRKSRPAPRPASSTPQVELPESIDLKAIVSSLHNDHAAGKPTLLIEVGGHDGSPPTALIHHLDPALSSKPTGPLEQLQANADLLEQKALLHHQRDAHEPAILTQAQAVDAWRLSVAHAPGDRASQRQLGAALNQYAVFFAVCGRFPDAVDQGNEAMRVLAPLSNDEPGTTLPVMRGALGNIVRFLEQSGQHNDANRARNDLTAIDAAIAALG
jgi:hypothetical protein